LEDEIMAREFVGVIQKIKFGDETEVYHESYRDAFRSNPDWQEWNTPVRFNNGWRLFLYDPVDKAITVTAVIEEVSESSYEEFPWCNTLIADTIKVDPEIWIPLSELEAISGLEKIGKGPRPYWYLDENQAQQLLLDRVRSA
jgi:hypothetical protein